MVGRLGGGLDRLVLLLRNQCWLVLRLSRRQVLWLRDRCWLVMRLTWRLVLRLTWRLVLRLRSRCWLVLRLVWRLVLRLGRRLEAGRRPGLGRLNRGAGGPRLGRGQAETGMELGR